jgi:dsDNA-binding SOS-regulon protein
MAVIVQYVVVKDGVEKMTFTTKKEADAYDKMLDIAENLYGFLESSNIEIGDEKLDELTFFIAQNSDAIAAILKGGAPNKVRDDAKSGPAKTAKSAKDKDAADTAQNPAAADTESKVRNIGNKDAA